MAVTDFNSALSGASNKSAAALIAAQELRGIYVVADSENPTALNPGFVKYLMFMGNLFWLDLNDSITAHDGVTCCVTADGKRFKTFAFAGPTTKTFKIISRTLTAAPASPAIGDSYIVAIGATGLWAGKDKYIATWTVRGWMFVVPNTYDMAFVISENQIYNFAATALWVAGVPAINNGPNSIAPSMIKYGRFGFSAANQTTNTLPVSPVDGDIFIVGPAPTGPLIGYSQYIAVCEGTSFILYPYYIGAQCFDKSLKNLFIFFDGIWNSQPSFDPAAPILKASCLLNCFAVTGTYSRSGTLITITHTAHGMETGQAAYFLFGAGGAATNGYYTVTVIDPNTYRVTDTASGATSASVTRVFWLKASYNILNVVKGVIGQYTFTFKNNLLKSYYIVNETATFTDGYSTTNTLVVAPHGKSVSGFSVNVTENSTDTAADPSELNITVML